MDLAKWYPDRFGRFLATIAARDVLWVQAQSQIAPDKQEKATRTVIEQAELICADAA
jgi:hypothetical protein